MFKKTFNLLLIGTIFSAATIATGVVLKNKKSIEINELNNKVQNLNLSTSKSNEDITSDFKNSLNSNVTFNSIDPNNQFINLHNPKANENFELRAQIVYNQNTYKRNFVSNITNHYSPTKLSSFEINNTKNDLYNIIWNTFLSVYPNKIDYKMNTNYVIDNNNGKTYETWLNIPFNKINIDNFANIQEYINKNKTDSRFWFNNSNSQYQYKINSTSIDVFANIETIFNVGGGIEDFERGNRYTFEPSYVNPETRQYSWWSFGDRKNAGSSSNDDKTNNIFSNNIVEIQNQFNNIYNNIFTSSTKLIENEKFTLNTKSFITNNQLGNSNDKYLGNKIYNDVKINNNDTSVAFRVYDNSTQNFQDHNFDKYFNTTIYQYPNDIKKEPDGAKIGNFDTRNMLSQIQIFLNELINIDANNTSDETNNGKVWTTAPKIKFGWNLDLLNNIYEAKRIADVVYKIYQNFDTIYNFNGNQELAKNVNKLLNDIYFGKIGLERINQYLDQLQNSNGTAMAYIASDNKNNTADYIVNAAKYGWNFGIANNNGTISFIDSITGKNNDKWNEIFDMNIIYNYVLPQIFQNNIYVDYTSTGSNVVNTVKIYDGSTCSWEEFYINDYGSQVENLNNNVDVNIKNIYMKTIDNVLIAGQGSNNKTLNLNNIYNIATNEKLNSYIGDVQTNIKFNARNELVFNFKYNSQFLNSNTGNNTIDVIDKKKTIANFSGTVSSILGAWGDYGSAIISQDEIRKQVLLNLPDNVKNEWNNINENTNSSILNIISPFQLVQDTTLENFVPSEIVNNHADLKNYNDLLTKYSKYMSIATGASRPQGNMTYEEARQLYYDYSYQLDNLGYFYKTISFYKPLEYYIAPDKWQEYESNGTFISNGTQQYAGSTYYNYIVKLSANYKPIDKDNLAKYVTISSIKSEVAEEATLNEYMNQLETVNKSLIDSQVKIQLLKKKIIGLDSEIEYINSQTEILFNQYLNDNPELKAQYESLVESTDKNINEQIDIFEKAYNDFDSIDDYVGSGVKQYLNKTFKYDEYLDNLLNVYKTKLASLNSLFESTAIGEYILNQVTSMINNVKSSIETIKNELNTELDNLYTISYPSYDIEIKMKKFNELNYVDKFNISFNLEQMYKDTNNPWYKSRYYLCDQQKLANFFYYYDMNNFGKKLDQIIFDATNIVTHLGFDDNLNFKFADSIVTESNEKEWCEYAFSDISQIYKMIYDETVNRIFININCINRTILKTKNQMNDDINRVKKEIDSINKKIVSNNNLFHNNANDIRSYLLLLDNKTNDLNNINVDNVIPIINQTNNNISDIQNAINNYNDFQVSKWKWNSGVMAGIIIGSIVGVGLLIGLVIYLSSLKRHKTKPIPKADKIALDKALEEQNSRK